jgi:hypothetical protein
MPRKKDKSPMMGPLSKPNAVNLAVGDVHRDFEAETHFGVLRLAPHNFSPEG